MKPLLSITLLGLAGCSGSDWRQAAIADAEAAIRAQVNNPSLKFSHVQFTGDDR